MAEAAKKSRANAVMMVTFGVFMTEAILYYNLSAQKSTPKQERKLMLPPPVDLLKIAAIVAVFSVINGAIIGAIEKK